MTYSHLNVGKDSHLLSSKDLEVNPRYVDWQEEQADVLASFTDKKVWVLFSGGQDSSLALYFLHKAREVFNFSFEVHAGIFPKHRYVPSETKRIDAYWNPMGVEIQWHDIRTSDDALDRAKNPCMLCQKVRKSLLHKVVSRKVSDFSNLVLVTAYTLSDLVSYTIEYLISTVYSVQQGSELERSQERFLETGQRFYRFFKMNDGFTVYRPILRYNRQEIIRMVREANVPILTVPCRFGHFRPKRRLDSYYKSIGVHFDYDKVVMFARETLGLPSIDEYASMNKDDFLKRVF
jgi:tRNA(Ile)-lysidine synthase TilS/MesJ